ncbi:hypothetical protein CYMTET_46261 [Cymbomonas tetramitiformis]|uniref:Uncharacterized protein n=1 Tax=Cymbomonas tetramitiformis TaxID=36881 RepID=A0AAE0BYD6_9CHLO|nr:hypothetical protein CYMTET_46261 [Cymbomonas tetramitiformis]
MAAWDSLMAGGKGKWRWQVWSVEGVVKVKRGLKELEGQLRGWRWEMSLASLGVKGVVEGKRGLKELEGQVV